MTTEREKKKKKCDCKDGLRGKDCYDYHPVETRQDDSMREAEKVVEEILDVIGDDGFKNWSDTNAGFIIEEIVASALRKKDEEIERQRKIIHQFGLLVKEQLLRSVDGYIHVGHGCELAVRGTTKELNQLKDSLRILTQERDTEIKRARIAENSLRIAEDALRTLSEDLKVNGEARGLSEQLIPNALKDIDGLQQIANSALQRIRGRNG